MFFPAVDVVSAEFSKAPGFKITGKKSAARLAGLRYEKKVQGFLKDRYKERYYRSPWIKFRCKESRQLRWCQPDGFLIDFPSLKLIIIEIKLKHTQQAWRQLTELYKPVLITLLGLAEKDWEISMCEIVHWYDPLTRTVPSSRCYRHIEDVKPDEFGVHILNPARILRERP